MLMKKSKTSGRSRARTEGRRRNQQAFDDPEFERLRRRLEDAGGRFDRTQEIANNAVGTEREEMTQAAFRDALRTLDAASTAICDFLWNARLES